MRHLLCDSVPEVQVPYHMKPGERGSRRARFNQGMNFNVRQHDSHSASGQRSLAGKNAGKHSIPSPRVIAIRHSTWALLATTFLLGCGGEPAIPVNHADSTVEAPTILSSARVREGRLRAQTAWELSRQDRDVDACREAAAALQTLSSLETELAGEKPSLELAELRQGQAECGFILEDLKVLEREAQRSAELFRDLLGAESSQTLWSELLWAWGRFTLHQDAKSLEDMVRVTAGLERQGDSPEAWWGLRLCGYALIILNRPREALEYEQRALEVARRAKLSLEVLLSEIDIARNWMQLGDFERARSLVGPIHEELQRREERTVFAANVAEMWSNLQPEGESSRETLLQDVAKSFHTFATDLAVAGGLHQAAWQFSHRVRVLLQSQAYEEADLALQEVRRLGKELGDEQWQVAFHRGRSALLAAQEQWDGAVEELQQALTFAQRSQGPAVLADLYAELAALNQKAQKLDQALQSYESCLSLVESQPHLGPRPVIAFEAGKIYEELNLPQKALERYQQSQVGLARHGIQPAATHLLEHVGNMQRELKDWNAAAATMTEAVRQYHKFELTVHLPGALKAQGEALLRSEAFAAAIPVLAEARQRWPEPSFSQDPVRLDRAKLSLWLAICHLKEGNQAEASLSLRDMDVVVEALPASPGRAYFSRQAGDELREMGYAAEAVTQYRQADHRFQELGWDPYAALMQFLVGDCQRTLGERDAAYTSYLSGLDRLATLKQETEQGKRYEAFGYELLQICSHDLLTDYLTEAVKSFKVTGDVDRAVELQRRQQEVDFPPTFLGKVGLGIRGTTEEEYLAFFQQPANVGKDSMKTQVYITQILPDMPVAVEGTAQVGDELVAVIQQDGTRHDVSGYYVDAVRRLLVGGVPGTSLIMVLKRKGIEQTFQTKSFKRADGGLRLDNQAREVLMSVIREWHKQHPELSKALEQETLSNGDLPYQAELITTILGRMANGLLSDRLLQLPRTQVIDVQERRSDFREKRRIIRDAGLLHD
jgi:tetratricopeptide (TPR) repeat protein